MKPLSLFGPIGLTMAIWSFFGILRFLQEKFFPIKNNKKTTTYKPSDIAVILPAHNEELVIRRTIRSLRQSLEPSQIYVASDGSTDRTARRAKLEGVHVSSIMPGKGKAKALTYLIKKYNLYKKYKFIFILDADTQLDKNYIPGALKMFEDPDIKVVYAAPHIRWPDHLIPRLPYYFIAYRERLNQILRYMMQYGQTWKFTNVTYVIPGYCTIYRSETLKKIPIDTPGLLIEDFNTAFYFHKHKLGKVGFHPSLIAWDQHPNTLADYWKQVKRWNIGFFQTVKLNGVWPSWFWLTLGLFTFEVFLNSIFILLLPLSIFFLLVPYLGITNPDILYWKELYLSSPIVGGISFFGLYVRVLIIDYFLTVIIGWMIRKPQFVIYGLFFIFMHYVTSLILIAALVPGFLGKSQGIWVSPKRHTIGMESVKI